MWKKKTMQSLFQESEIFENDAFSGITRSDGTSIAWHSAYQMGRQIVSSRMEWEASLKEDHITEDIGLVQKVNDDEWFEFHPNGDYEEKWLRIAGGEKYWSAISEDYDMFVVSCGGYTGVMEVKYSMPMFRFVDSSKICPKELVLAGWKILEDSEKSY